jgi:OFA family oxalate/formate antiporter-like MFS transporter
LSRQPETIPAGKSKLFYGWYMVAISWTLLFLISAVPIAIFFKPILDEFGWSRRTLSLVQTVSMLVSMAITPLLGLLIDKIGPRAMLFITAVVQAISSVTTGLASNLSFIYVGRILAEVRPMAATQVLINRWFVIKRGRAQGIFATGRPIGIFALIPLSQYLILTWGWRPTMLFWAGVVFAITIAMAWFVLNQPEDKKTGPDGVALETAAASPNREVLTKYRVEKGNTLAESIRTGAFWLISGTQLICGIGCGFMMTHIVIFATDVGFSEMIGATFMSIHGIFNLFGVLLIGYLSDHIARNKALALTHFIRSLSFAIIIVFLVLGNGSLWILFLAMALFGFGWFTTAPLTSVLVADLFGYRQMGAIAGVIGAGHVIGTAIGVYAGGATFELTHSYYWFFLIQGCLELLAAVLALAIRRKAY